MKLRLEESKDYKIVENLIREAFWNVYKPGCDEHFIMHQLRKDESFVSNLDYVLEVENEIVAHIVYSLGKLKKENGDEVDALIFGPVGVLPSKQKQGYGSYIITETLKIAKNLGYPCVVITGNPKYYHRFGFETASNYEIYHDQLPKDIPVFMVKVLDEEKMKDFKGIYSDPKCYYVDEKDVEEFDQQFPPKVKEKRPGQLQ